MAVKEISCKLPAVITIADVELLHDQLLGIISTDSPCLDASEVERIDTAAFQQLVAFCTALKKTNTQLVWTGCSEIFLASAKQIGLKDALGLSDQAA